MNNAKETSDARFSKPLSRTTNIQENKAGGYVTKFPNRSPSAEEFEATNNGMNFNS